MNSTAWAFICSKFSRRSTTSGATSRISPASIRNRNTASFLVAIVSRAGGSNGFAARAARIFSATGNICGIKGTGFADGLGDQGFACEVHDGVNGMFGEDFFDLRADAEIGFAEDRFGRYGGGVAFLKIVESDDLVASG